MLRLLRACRRWCIMSTYEELQLIVSVALLILAILTYTHKKQPSCPGKADGYLQLAIRRSGDVVDPFRLSC